MRSGSRASRSLFWARKIHLDIRLLRRRMLVDLVRYCMICCWYEVCCEGTGTAPG
jgi:hypothetical protein